MAQQTFSRSGTSAILAMVSRKEPEAEMLSIPLDLRPLLEPYKDHKKLMLRVERLPQRARLSAGQNNGDQSWSIASDELADLRYLFPSDLQETLSLAIRVINPIDGATVAVLSHRISPSGAVLEAPQNPPAPRSVPNSATDAEVRALRNQLAAAKAALAASEADSGALLKQREEAWKQHSRELVEAALKKAKAEYDAEFSGRLKDVADRAEETIMARRAAWQSELDASIAESEKRVELARTEARASAKREGDAAFALERQAWKAEEAQRLAAAEAKWREGVRAIESEARTRSQKSEQDAAELARLRERLAAAEKISESREKELENARNALSATRENLKREAEAALVRAKADWTSEETKRLTALEARLRAESDVALGEAGARRERAERALSEAVKQIELLSARRNESEASASDEASALRANLASAHAALAQAREQAMKDLEARLEEARGRWKKEEEGRASAAEVRFREQLRTASGDSLDMRSRADDALAKAEAQARLAEEAEQKRRELEAQVKALEATWKAREIEDAQVKERERRRADAALADARKEWAAGEAARIKEAEARFKADSQKALEDANARRETAEHQLAESRQREANPRDRVEMLKLRDELEKMRLALEMRDLELRQARTNFSQVSADAPNAPSLAPLKRGRMAMRDTPEDKEERQRKNRNLARDIALVAIAIFLIALAPLSRPFIEPLLPYSLQDQIDQEFGDLYASAPAAPAKPKLVTPAPGTPVLPTETVLKAASLHKGPSRTSPVLSTLKAGAKVVRLEEQGSWVRVAIGDTPNGPAGWVSSSALSGPAP